MRKILYLLFPAVLLLAACGSSSSTTGATTCTPKVDPSTLKLVQTGQLVVATDASYPPQEYTDANQKIVGMEVDLATEFAKRLCLTITMVNVKFDNIIPGLTGPALGSQRYDLSISAFSVTDDRKTKVDMVPYFQAGESILVPVSNPKKIQGLPDLCGLNVAVENGTVEKDELLGAADGSTKGINQAGGACEKKPVNVLAFDDQNQVTQQLLSGRADATYQDSPVTDYYANLNKGKVEAGPTTVAPSPEGIVLRKDNPALENAITSILTDMRADGTYKKILDQWGTTKGAYPPLG